MRDVYEPWNSTVLGPELSPQQRWLSVCSTWRTHFISFHGKISPSLHFLLSLLPPSCYFLWHVKRAMLFLEANGPRGFGETPGWGWALPWGGVAGRLTFPSALSFEAHPQSRLCVWLLLEGSQSQSQAWRVLLTRKGFPPALGAERKMVVLTTWRGKRASIMGCFLVVVCFYGPVLTRGVQRWDQQRWAKPASSGLCFIWPHHSLRIAPGPEQGLHLPSPNWFLLILKTTAHAPISEWPPMPTQPPRVSFSEGFMSHHPRTHPPPPCQPWTPHSWPDLLCSPWISNAWGRVCPAVGAQWV